MFRNFEETLTKDLLNQHVNDFLSNDSLFCCERLINPIAADWALPFLQECFPWARNAHTSTKAHLSGGFVQKSDVVMVEVEPPNCIVGETRGFFEITCDLSERLIQVSLFTLVSGTTWCKLAESTRLYRCNQVVAPLFYAELGHGNIKIVEPSARCF